MFRSRSWSPRSLRHRAHTFAFFFACFFCSFFVPLFSPSPSPVFCLFSFVSHPHTHAQLYKPSGNQTYCPETATSEQYFQLTFFDRPGAGSKVAVRKGRPVSPSCVQLPPRGYVWPAKHALVPVSVTPGTDAVHWPNLRVATLRDLLVFNRGTPKNLYHFNASFYDYEQEQIVAHAARYIPFDQKVRVMLDIGSGGGSLGLLLKRRYDVQVVSTVFADWPYCEYITERGNLCMYVDAMEAMPFAKFSYDVIHSSWVFHALLNQQLTHTFLEQNRILRPGGYMWSAFFCKPAADKQSKANQEMKSLALNILSMLTSFLCSLLFIRVCVYAG